jgi:hypothetical protein
MVPGGIFYPGQMFLYVTNLVIAIKDGDTARQASRLSSQF